MGGLSRRALLATGAALMAPRAWSAAGAPAYLGAARLADGAHALIGLSAAGGEVFRLPLPARGHAAARHPGRPEAVVFARRPGTFALVIDCAAGVERVRLAAPPGRHFYGHGAFSADGGLLYTTENAFESGEGRIGIWETAGYRRIGEIASGGIGPHEVLLMPGGVRLAVANGGIRTHPDAGRAKLNLATMAPNLAYLDAASGRIAEVAEPPADLRMNSIRHIAARADGTVAAAMQWEGAALEAPPILALHRPGSGLQMLPLADPLQRRTRGYGGSVAFAANGAHVAITAPRGNLMAVFAVEGGASSGLIEAEDVCGVAAAAGGFMASTGLGHLLAVEPEGRAARLGGIAGAFDNHLVAV